ncbi:hypothetical protein BN14_01223 [Rhizoctonia solani AG-1 IB]|uniref:BTB domain-containing protein n=1 Tax=Thanatephorus cucumeris (strain AG1-IB / isolate 7/3/14) TaxID=1108050 RepID=M5BJ06_THACB|nr:hypothetical protein BN14_01223 [Rhizoctonia solani AG-1 IB]
MLRFTLVNPEFAFQDGSIEIRTIDQAFWVHEYHMNKFSVLAAIIQKAKGSIRDSGCRTVLVCEPKILGTDIYNALKVIYASHLDGIPDFDSNIIISALRIASTLEFPGLRNFAISKLEGMVLSAIQRIQLSDEFSLPSLEMPAFIELCNRAEPITLVEADILGTSRFVEIARIRETQRLHQAAKLVENILPKLLESTQLRSSTGTEYARDGPG